MQAAVSMRLRWWLFSAVCLWCLSGIGATSQTTCGELTACRCLEPRTVDCVATGNSIGLFPTDGANYRFDRNGWRRLELSSFVRLRNATSISARKNSIATVDARTFAGNRMLEAISLSYNLIKTLPESLFAATPKLARLDCGNNRLTSIGARLFRGLTQLVEIRLSGNRLKMVDSAAFASQTRLAILDLEGNRLRTAHWHWIGNMGEAVSKGRSYIGLGNNPWSCDCRMTTFWQNATQSTWAKDNTQGSEDCQAVCPLRLPECLMKITMWKVSILTLNQSDLVCVAPSLSVMRHTANLPAAQVTLYCQGQGFPVPKVQIVDHLGQILATSEGNASYTVARQNITGRNFSCLIQGINSRGQITRLNGTFKIPDAPTVSPYRGRAFFAVLVVLLFVAFGVQKLCRNSSSAMTSWEVWQRRNREQQKEPKIHNILRSDKHLKQSIMKKFSKK